MDRLKITLLIIVFVLGFAFRLYRFDGPVADWHSWRQSDTAAVSKIFNQKGINVLYPKYYDISNIQSGKDNPQGLRLVEFPIYNVVQTFFYQVFDYLNLEQWGRIVSIFATLSSALFIFLLTKKYSNETAAFFASLFMLFLPFSIYFGRTILPDPSMAAAILAGIYFFDLWIENSAKLKVKNLKLQFKIHSFFILSIFLTASAFLLKPYALFFTLPMIYLAYKRFGIKLVVNWQLWLFAIISLTPLIFWRNWIGQYPEGVPASDWLFNSNGIRFRPAFFRWIFYERITRSILGYLGVIFLAAGVYKLKNAKNSGFFLSFIASSLLYLFVIATGNVQHDYYQILIIPTVSIICGIGVAFLFSKFKKNYFGKAFIGFLVFLSIFIAWFGISKNGLGGGVRDFFNINDRGMVAAGKKADEILPTDALVIAPYGGSTSFLYQIGRKGWPALEKSIEELIKMGAGYLVIANPTESDFKGFGTMYPVVASSEAYLILKLK
ncbi:MAG: hypothetical protein Q8P10_00235 [bacterium]|nr:hypothetical protein [bacterium]